jgi:hypothetical protein
LNGGAPSTTGSLVWAFASGSDLTSAPAWLRLRDPGAAWAPVPQASWRTLWLLPANLSSVVRLEAQFKDQAGNISTLYSTPISFNFNLEQPHSSRYRLLNAAFASTSAAPASAGYRLIGGLGQPSPVGAVSSPSFRLESGFWIEPPPAAVYRYYFPLLYHP